MVFPFVILTGYQMPSMIIFLILGPSLQARYHMHLDYLIVTNNSFELNPTDNSNVFFFQSLLSKLCKSKATGLDKISARLLRECADLIARSLCLIAFLSTSGNARKSFQYSNKRNALTWTIIAQFLLFRQWRKFLKESQF